MAEKELRSCLAETDGVVVPGGFGVRGTEGKIMSVKYARENDLPFLGLCLGMQMAVAEFARNVAGMEGANSSEFDPDTKFPVIDLLPEQAEVSEMGGTMRLGSSPSKLVPGTKAHAAYGSELIHERHRHRYEVNNEYRDRLAKAGLVISGTTVDEGLVEMIELKDHPWFLACQFHPEFKSRPTRPHPLFRDFVGAAISCEKREQPQGSQTARQGGRKIAAVGRG
jgi:CTP synthase